MTNDTGDDLEQWRSAQAYSALLGEIPSSFTTAARALKLDTDKGATSISDSSRFQVNRLLKSAIVESTFNAFAKHHEKFLSNPAKNGEELVKSIPPIATASILGALFYHRRIKKIVPNDEWAYILPFLTKDLDIAIPVGLTIPKIGIDKAILSIAGRYFSLAAFMLHDKKGFVEYRRYLKGRNFAFDTNWEISRWGCHSGQVATTLFQTFGLGVETVTGLADGIAHPLGTAPRDSNSYPFWIICEWVKALYTTGKEPQMGHKPAYYPDLAPLSVLIEEVKQIKAEPQSRSRWLDEGGEPDKEVEAE